MIRVSTEWIKGIHTDTLSFALQTRFELSENLVWHVALLHRQYTEQVKVMSVYHQDILHSSERLLFCHTKS
jgi:hypothetical protein